MGDEREPFTPMLLNRPLGGNAATFEPLSEFAFNLL
jgi:hypothetical protein